ncbi:ParB/RepB/Spo0J family partition protein [Photobacterium leiognathi]|uniref:ParB/RepB/Spo0J family partition protein n=1 Tax=Photobacterium leiognathi TaxID=553611 RepID=UPI002981A8F2|nr:ParB/RepB/Spo0J family partition protein [Photobacterium leiognathi]
MASLRDRAANFDMTSLLDDRSVEIIDGDTIKKIPKDFLYSVDQVRTEFNDDSLLELAENIMENGQQSPIIVHPVDSTNKYCIHQGERRWRAICLLDDIETVDCLIRSNNTMYQQLSENIQRENLSPYEIAAAISNLKKKDNIKSTDVSKKLGKSKSWTSQYESISKMPIEIVNLLKIKNVQDINTIANIRMSSKVDLESTLSFINKAEVITREASEKLKNKLSNANSEKKSLKEKTYKPSQIEVLYNDEIGLIMSDSDNISVGYIDIMIKDHLQTVSVDDIKVIGYKNKLNKKV